MKWTITLCVAAVFVACAGASFPASAGAAAGHVITNFEDFTIVQWASSIKHNGIVIEEKTSQGVLDINNTGSPGGSIAGKNLQIKGGKVNVVAQITWPEQLPSVSFDFAVVRAGANKPSFSCRYTNGAVEETTLAASNGTGKCMVREGTMVAGVDIAVPRNGPEFIAIDNIVTP